jgi:transcriptional regulator PpsR
LEYLTMRESLAMPDVKLILDPEGVIREAAMAGGFAGERPERWLGRPWTDTVGHTDGAQLRRMLDEARSRGVSAFHQVLQRLPSGAEAPVEYTAVRLEKGNALLAIGKSLRAVTELQNRLVEAQQAMERDFWRLREVETRYRLLFDATSDAVLLLDANDLEVLELNPAATQILELMPQEPGPGAASRFVDRLPPQDREAFVRMLRQLRERGKAPGMLLRLGEDREPWLARVSLLAGTLHKEVLLVQLAPTLAQPRAAHNGEAVPAEDLLERAPDAFVVIDQQGTILHANGAFLEMVQVGSEPAVLGEPLGRWLGRPGADLTVLLANVLRLGAVRLFATTLHGQLGTEREVEISASGNAESDPDHIGVFIRDVGRRLNLPGRRGGVGQLLESLTQQIGKTSLRKLVEDAVQAVERHYIEEALKLTGGNRTAAAELLGLSRQSLYVKLNRYAVDGDAKPETS